MELTQILTLVTVVVSWGMGYVAKKNSWFKSNLIPVQNVIIGLVVAIIEWIITKDFSLAISLSGLFAGGSYDLAHNLSKLKKIGGK